MPRSKTPSISSDWSPCIVLFTHCTPTMRGPPTCTVPLAVACQGLWIHDLYHLFPRRLRLDGSHAIRQRPPLTVSVIRGTGASVPAKKSLGSPPEALTSTITCSRSDFTELDSPSIVQYRKHRKELQYHCHWFLQHFSNHGKVINKKVWMIETIDPVVVQCGRKCAFNVAFCRRLEVHTAILRSTPLNGSQQRSVPYAALAGVAGTGVGLATTPSVTENCSILRYIIVASLPYLDLSHFALTECMKRARTLCRTSESWLDFGSAPRGSCLVYLRPILL